MDDQINNPHFRDLDALSSVFAGDYDHCHGRLEGEDCQFYRRALVRNVGAMAEGLSSIMRDHASKSASGTDDAQKAVLRGISYGVGKNGEIEERKLRISIIDNFCFAFRWYAKAFYSNYELDKNCAGWREFEETIAIRNRLMHPRCGSDLEVTDSEALITKKAFCYVYNSIMRLLSGSPLIRRPGARIN